MFSRSLATLLGAAALLSMGAMDAAAIECRNGDQRVQGTLIATPYCQDQLLALVAREHGLRASADAIRSNPNLKRDVCRLVGRDIRIQATCGEVNAAGRGGRF